jgi:DNA-binding CsgD family transcriptional regulator
VGDTDGWPDQREVVVRPMVSSGSAPPPLTSSQSEAYAGLVRHRTDSHELEQRTRRSVAAALESGLTWPVIAAGLGTPLRATMSWYGVVAAGPGNGAMQLTGEEQRILALVLEGLTNQAIAEQLYMSKRSLEAQLTRLYKALGVTSKAELRTLRQLPGGLPHASH